MSTQNCNICDEPVLLLLGEYYEVADLSVKKSPRRIIATLVPHSCKSEPIILERNWRR